MTPAFLAAALGLIGLTIGSFLNVCIYRLPLGQSIVFPASRCPSCKKALQWYHNVPVVSWLVLGGRCAYCRQSISARYPAVELLTGVVFALHAPVFGDDLPLLAVRLAFAAALIVLAFIDIDHRILPNGITLPGIAIGLVLSVWLPPGWRASLIGVLLGGGEDARHDWGGARLAGGARDPGARLVRGRARRRGPALAAAGRDEVRAAVRHVPRRRGARRQPGGGAARHVVSLVLPAGLSAAAGPVRRPCSTCPS
jgi:hypothetical protein